MGATSLTPFGKEVKRKLLDFDKDQGWLIDQVKRETDMYFDRSYLSKILSGKTSAVRFRTAICEILDIEDPEGDCQNEDELLYCSKCGMAISGKFCSNCGARVQRQVEEFRKAERKEKENYERALTCNANGELIPEANMQLISACWLASSMKYGYENNVHQFSAGESVPEEAYDNLKIIKEHAVKLYLALVQF